MKKLIFMILSILMLSCSNENDNLFNGNSGLIKVKTDKGGDNSYYIGDSTTKFYYSEGNKLKKVEYYSKTLDYENNFQFLYFYKNDLIIRIEAKDNLDDGRKINLDFEYNNEDKLIKLTRKSTIDSKNFETHNYNHLTNGNIIDIDDNDNTVELEFDNNKNLISDGERYGYTYTYDNMKSPYSDILGLDKIYFVELHLFSEIYPEYYNNIKTTTQNINRTFMYSYEYNSEGKPLKNNYSTYYDYY